MYGDDVVAVRHIDPAVPPMHEHMVLYCVRRSSMNSAVDIVIVAGAALFSLSLSHLALCLSPSSLPFRFRLL